MVYVSVLQNAGFNKPAYYYVFIINSTTKVNLYSLVLTLIIVCIVIENLYYVYGDHHKKHDMHIALIVTARLHISKIESLHNI